MVRGHFLMYAFAIAWGAARGQSEVALEWSAGAPNYRYVSDPGFTGEGRTVGHFFMGPCLGYALAHPGRARIDLLLAADYQLFRMDQYAISTDGEERLDLRVRILTGSVGLRIDIDLKGDHQLFLYPGFRIGTPLRSWETGTVHSTSARDTVDLDLDEARSTERFRGLQVVPEVGFGGDLPLSNGNALEARLFYRVGLTDLFKPVSGQLYQRGFGVTIAYRIRARSREAPPIEAP
ncbi:MAG: hypothetical protein H6595_08500 [Flavobacteriales bacterium]|nr:hypothetical protein [Flavobacteriales bacterium]MCB9167506.1 hypothetical protein [Flavobacteriales bacterium]